MPKTIDIREVAIVTEAEGRSPRWRLQNMHNCAFNDEMTVMTRLLLFSVFNE